MGEFEVAHLRRFGFGLAVDEPYQHYHYAGRADVVAWDARDRALLHIENRTRFPDFQEMAGSFNSKRAYLGAAMAERVGILGWASETHVIAALWSSEVLHALRMRTASVHALCPSDVRAFEGWWEGVPPPTGRWSVAVALDPLASGRQRTFVGLEDALTVRSRYRGYADAASAMMTGGE